MKYILLLLVVAFAAPVFGQDAKPSNVENPLASNWSKLGPTVEGARGFTLHGRGIRLNGAGQYELWVKIVPTNVSAFVRRYDLPRATDHVLQFATVDCTKRVLSLEKTAVYESANNVLEARTSALTPSSKKAAVKSGSIGEALYRFVCVEATSLPITKAGE